MKIWHISGDKIKLLEELQMILEEAFSTSFS